MTVGNLVPATAGCKDPGNWWKEGGSSSPVQPLQEVDPAEGWPLQSGLVLCSRLTHTHYPNAGVCTAQMLGSEGCRYTTPETDTSSTWGRGGGCDIG